MSQSCLSAMRPTQRRLTCSSAATWMRVCWSYGFCTARPRFHASVLSTLASTDSREISSSGLPARPKMAASTVSRTAPANSSPPPGPPRRQVASISSILPLVTPSTARYASRKARARKRGKTSVLYGAPIFFEIESTR